MSGLQYSRVHDRAQVTFARNSRFSDCAGAQCAEDKMPARRAKHEPDNGELAYRDRLESLIAANGVLFRVRRRGDVQIPRDLRLFSAEGRLRRAGEHRRNSSVADRRLDCSSRTSPNCRAVIAESHRVVGSLPTDSLRRTSTVLAPTVARSSMLLAISAFDTGYIVRCQVWQLPSLSPSLVADRTPLSPILLRTIGAESSIRTGFS